MMENCDADIIRVAVLHSNCNGHYDREAAVQTENLQTQHI